MQEPQSRTQKLSIIKVDVPESFKWVINQWNIWNRERQIFDLTKLFVGSQGTLGFITEVTLKLIRPKKHSTLLVIFMRDMGGLIDIIQKVLAHKPESFESYDDHTLKIALKVFPEIVKKMGSNFLSLAWEFLPELGMLITGKFPKMVMIAEFTGDSVQEARDKAKRALKDVKGLGVTARVTKSEKEAKKYWTIRRESFNLLRKNIKGKHTAPFIDDLIVRPEKLPEFLPKLNAIMGEYNIIYTIAGHIGDGNFHIIPLMDLHDEKQRKIIPELSKRVYNLVFKFKFN